MSLVIAGASMAGARAARAAREAGYQGRIRLIGEEPTAPYKRPPLSKKLLTDSVDLASLALESAEFYASHGVELELGVRATALEVSSRRLVLDNGARVEFEHLVIATGAAPRRLSVPGAHLDGIVTLRTAQEAVEFKQRLSEAGHVVVVGAGLLGLEVAAAARAAGKTTVVLDRAPYPMARLVHPAAGALIARRVAEHGVDLRLGCTSVVFNGTDRVESVTLADGTTLPADLVLVSIGVVPNTSWLADSGVELGDGVLVDEAARTNVPFVYAAGDVTSSWHPALRRRVRLERNGHASEQAKTAVRSAMGFTESYEPELYGGTSAFGDRFQCAGLSDPGHELVLRGDPSSGGFVAFGLRDGEVHSAFALNRPDDMTAIREWMARRPRASPSQLADAGADLRSIG